MDNCASNCTLEKVVQYQFTGAQCFGGAKNTQTCHFIKSCTAGQFIGKTCSVNANCGTGGVCTNECGTNSDCFGIGLCTAGAANKIGTLCPSSPLSPVPPSVVKVCQGGTKSGSPCSVNTDCTGGGTCVNPCSPGLATGICTHRSGAVLQTDGVLGALSVGPLAGGLDLVIGKQDANMIVPVSVPAGSVAFNPVKVPTLACACPHGLVVTQVHGPGNSASGMIGCGASGLPNPNVITTVDHNTTPSDIHNGPGTCSGGTRNGLACSTVSSDCPGGSCSGTGGGGGVCVSGANVGKVCHIPADCPSSICASPDDASCTATDPAPPAGSGSKACLEAKVKCFGGPAAGAACSTDADCFGTPTNGITCGTDCPTGPPNPLGLHPGACNSPVHLLLTAPAGASPPGTALVINTIALGVIATPADNGTCSKAAICTPVVFNSAPTVCEVNSECSPNTCSTAFCAGICNSGSNTGRACAGDADCGGAVGSCTAGAQYGQACVGNVVGECGAQNICQPVNAAKGFDGLPCTADDPPSSQGAPSTIPTTTSTASAAVIDVNNAAGKQMFGTLCTGQSGCVTSLSGFPFNCTNLLAATPSASGAGLASAFTQLDGATTGDGVVTNRLTAK